MLKKTLIIILYLLLTGVLCCYFIFSSKITKEGKMHEMCHQIKVVILDSAEIRFVSKTEIADLIVDNGITPGESKLRHINNYQIEQLLNKRTAVKKSEVSYTRDGILRVIILQRKPILRLQTENGGFYMDENAYVFPLIKGFSPFVPVVSGEIPLKIPPKYNGYVKNNEQWANSLKDLCLYILKNESWDALIEQIYVDSRGILSFIPRDGDFEIIFGNMDKIEYKFKKLYAFYKDILPNVGPEKYCKINLQFDKQIVCKKTNKNIEI
jgi:cell division protein FtsQ